MSKHARHRAPVRINTAKALSSAVASNAGAVGRPAAVLAASSGMLLTMGATANAATHTVERGDTLSKIANQHGVSLSNIFSLNGMGWNDTVIYPGDRIQYSKSSQSAPSSSVSNGGSTAANNTSSVSAKTHTVQSGDSLGRIASRYGISLQTVFQLNNMGWDTVIYPGDVIRVSGSAPASNGGAAQSNNDRRVSNVSNDVQKLPSASGLAATARAFQGVPYVWAGTSPAGWDCSGFVQYVYAQNGIDLPRIYQWHAMERTFNPKPGDVVVQNGGGHVGIYLGNGKMISALNPSQGTMIHNVNAMPVVGFYTM
ncbi:C40 family peptidase [Arthrobacter monumenti]